MGINMNAVTATPKFGVPLFKGVPEEGGAGATKHEEEKQVQDLMKEVVQQMEQQMQQNPLSNLDGSDTSGMPGNTGSDMLEDEEMLKQLSNLDQGIEKQSQPQPPLEFRPSQFGVSH